MVLIQMSFCDLNADMETFVIINNTLFQFSSHISQMLAQIIHIPHFCLVYSLLNYAWDFVINWIEVRAVQQPQIWIFMGVTTIIIALSEWRQQMMHEVVG